MSSKGIAKALAWSLAAATLAASPGAFAADPAPTGEDLAWINQCIADNKKEGATPDVVSKYCTCMNNEMDDGETKTITEWEKSHPDAVKKCDAEAGWK